MPFLKTCCCGCSLKKGTLIIGHVAFMGSILLVGSAFFTNPPGKPREENIVVILNGSAQIILTAMLVIGTKKGNRCLMLPWIIVNFIGTVLLAILIFYISYQMYTLEKENSQTSIDHESNKDEARLIITILASATVIFSLLFGLQIYLLLVVISHYQELKAEEMERRDNFLPIYSTPNHMSSNVCG